MSVLAERKAVSRVVVSRIGKSMDVSCVNDTAGGDGRQTITSQCTGVIVSCNNVQTEPNLAALPHRFFG
jgi:hypothetical protein